MNMRSKTLFLAGMMLLASLAFAFTRTISRTAAQDISMSAKLLGKWHEQTQTGGAMLDITSVDKLTGQIKGTYTPPGGPASGKGFEVIGWASSAPPIEKRDNVVVVSLTVSLSTYGSIASWTGYLKDNKIVAMWHNIRPNSAYEWDHIVSGQDIFAKVM
jgi:Avidin family